MQEPGRATMVSPPKVKTALEAARVAREAGRLRVAMRALDHVYDHLAEDPEIQDEVAGESELLGRELALRGASLSALGEWLRAQSMGRDQSKNVRHLVGNYAAWKPQASPVGAPKDGLTAGASGAFWVGSGVQGRLITLKGGITGEGTNAFARILEISSGEVDWLFVDMEQLSYVGSAGLAVAVKIAERLKKRPGGLSLFGLSSNLKLLVETLGLAHFLNPVETLGDALGVAVG